MNRSKKWKIYRLTNEFDNIFSMFFFHTTKNYRIINPFASHEMWLWPLGPCGLKAHKHLIVRKKKKKKRKWQKPHIANFDSLLRTSCISECDLSEHFGLESARITKKLTDLRATMYDFARQKKKIDYGNKKLLF
jgi:hypothetical protein